jgi:exopolysaccharide biosynthesis polyprenyl glycosylphosphotransferase
VAGDGGRGGGDLTTRERSAWPERLSLVALDAAAFATGLRLAHVLYRVTPLEEAAEAPPAQFEALAWIVAIQIVVMGGVFFFHQLYHQPPGMSRVDLMARLLRAVSFGVILTYACTSFVFPSLAYSRVIPVYDWATTFAAVAVARLAHRAVWGRLRAAGIGRHRVLIVGTGPTARDLVARIQRRPWLGYEVAGLVDDASGRARVRGVPVVGSLEGLGAAVDTLGVDEVIIALPEATRQQLVTLVSQCHREGVSIRVYPDVFEIIASGVQISDLDGLPLLTMRDVALRGWRRTLKRAVDVVLSTLALVALSPLLLLLAVLVKFESPGPAFYLQERMGLDARPFPIFKFRSMRMDAEARTGAVWARRDDPRRTRIGRFLRKSNLDELPQLINVLLGDMSIVGPRPERPEFVSEFRRHIPRYMERHREKAGLTGWAQVNGLRGDTSIEERTKYDLYYIENWSLLLDFKIMAKTLIAGFRDPNAY